MLLWWWSRDAGVARCSARPAPAPAARPRRPGTRGRRPALPAAACAWLPRNRFGALVAREARYWWRDAAAPGQPDHVRGGRRLPAGDAQPRRPASGRDPATLTGRGRAVDGLRRRARPRSAWPTSSASTAARTRRTWSPGCPGRVELRSRAVGVLRCTWSRLLIVIVGGGRRRCSASRRWIGVAARRARRGVRRRAGRQPARSRCSARTRCRTPPTRSPSASGAGVAKGLLSFGGADRRHRARRPVHRGHRARRRRRGCGWRCRSASPTARRRGARHVHGRRPARPPDARAAPGGDPAPLNSRRPATGAGGKVWCPTRADGVPRGGRLGRRVVRLVLRRSVPATDAPAVRVHRRRVLGPGRGAGGVHPVLAAVGHVAAGTTTRRPGSAGSR